MVRGDITERVVDAIVNTANSNLYCGGVAAAIVAKGGQIIQEESDKIGYVPTGNAVMTNARKLPCKAVIHVVGPTNGEGKENEKLTLAINNILSIAQQNNFKSISIPAISTGILGFPKEVKIKENEEKKGLLLFQLFNPLFYSLHFLLKSITVFFQ